MYANIGRALPSMFSVTSVPPPLPATPRWLNSVPFRTSVRVNDDSGTLTERSYVLDSPGAILPKTISFSSKMGLSLSSNARTR